MINLGWIVIWIGVDIILFVVGWYIDWFIAFFCESQHFSFFVVVDSYVIMKLCQINNMLLYICVTECFANN